MEIYHQYVRPRKQFGRHPRFVDEGAEMLADIRPNEEHAAECVPRNPMATATQCVPDMSEHEVNTTAVLYANKAISHVEGGWPKDVDCTEAEHTIRYRKKVEKDEDYIRTVVALGAAVEGLVKQNNTIDIYEEYFAAGASGGGGSSQHAALPPSARTLTVLKDPTSASAAGGGRPVSHINWSQDGGGSKAVLSYAILGFQQQPPGMPLSSYVWDLSNPTTPEAELAGASQLVAAKFNLKDSSLVGAGQYNGQFVVFDTRKGAAAAEATPIDVCHRDPVFDFAWLQSKTGTEALTVSTDGSVLWWDIRKLSEVVESMPLREKGSDMLLGGLSVDYDPAAGPTKFMVGCEQGCVLSCNRKAKNPADRVGTSFVGHHGPVYSVARNPFFPKFFMSAGDWTWRVWNEDLRSPLLVSPYARSYLAGGTWSPTRPGVFFTVQDNGMLSAWDLMYKHSEPTLQVQVSDQPLTSFALQDGGAVLGVGTADGCCSIMQLGAALVEPLPSEKQAINAMLEREILREKNLEKAQKEAKVKARREAQRATMLADTVTDDDLAAVEDAFLKATGAPAGLQLLAKRRGTAPAAAGASKEEQPAAAAAAAAASSRDA